MATKAGQEEKVKTSLALPRPIWRAARISALDQNKEFQEVVVEALEMYLKAKGGGR